MFVCGNGWRWSVFLLSPSQHTENTIREIRSHSVKLVLGLRHFSVAFCSRSYQIKSNRIASTFKSNKEPYLLKFRSDYLTIITSVASNSRRKCLFFRNKFFCFSLRRSISIGCVLCSLIKYLHCINIPDSHAFSFLFFSDCIIFCSRVLNAICCHSKIQAGWKDNFVTNNRLGQLMMVSWLPLTQRKHWWVSGVLGENMCRESERTY